uniref:Uncharacterized protein n=1 Tax=Anguilla anguilla TaxID=7936 RepID=A0A0E9VF51_ANGAN
MAPWLILIALFLLLYGIFPYPLVSLVGQRGYSGASEE